MPKSASWYTRYIGTGHWHAIRDRIRETRGPLCEWCDRHAVSIHHVTYERLGKELDSDLLLLCDDCHIAAHSLEIPFIETIYNSEPPDHIRPLLTKKYRMELRNGARVRVDIPEHERRVPNCW